MKTFLCALAALALAVTPAAAQTQSAEGYAEANRPKVTPRALTSEERRTLSDAVRTFEKTQDAAQLVRIQPMANAGDKTAMRTLFTGYGLARPESFGAVARPADAAFVLRALWGVAYFQFHGADREAAKAFENCLHPVRKIATSTDAGFYMARSKTGVDCGFSAAVETRNHKSLSDTLYDYTRGKGPIWRSATFTPRPLLTTEQFEAQEFERLLWLLGPDGRLVVGDTAWFNDYARRTPGAEARIGDRMAGNKEFNQYINDVNRARQDNVQAAIDNVQKNFPPGHPSRAAEIAKVEAMAINQGANSIQLLGKAGLPVSAQAEVTLCNSGNALYCGPPASRTASSSSSQASDPAALTQQMRDQSRATNQANCARASQGASITCNR